MQKPSTACSLLSHVTQQGAVHFCTGIQLFDTNNTTKTFSKIIPNEASRKQTKILVLKTLTWLEILSCGFRNGGKKDLDKHKVWSGKAEFACRAPQWGQTDATPAPFSNIQHQNRVIFLRFVNKADTNWDGVVMESDLKPLCPRRSLQRLINPRLPGWLIRLMEQNPSLVWLQRAEEINHSQRKQTLSAELIPQQTCSRG